MLIGRSSHARTDSQSWRDQHTLHRIANLTQATPQPAEQPPGSSSAIASLVFCRKKCCRTRRVLFNLGT